MSTITSRTLSFCLILSLLTCLIVPASAASSDPIEITPHDSAYFSQRRLSISPGGNGQLQISLFVAAKAIMSEVGATQIVVYEKQARLPLFGKLFSRGTCPFPRPLRAVRAIVKSRFYQSESVQRGVPGGKDRPGNAPSGHGGFP